MIKDIILIANSLDKKGLTKEADILDSLLIKMAQMAEEEELEDNSDSDQLVSAITTIIDKLSSQQPTDENSEKIKMLESLLEESL
jgi:hypothetical protein